MNEELTTTSFTILEKTNVLDDTDLKLLKSLRKELLHGYRYGQLFRTRTEQEVSVLNDLKFPTPDAKFWQAIREQQVHFSELVALSYDYQKNLQEIEILRAEIEELQEKMESCVKNYERKKLNAQLTIKRIDIARMEFMSAEQKRIAKARINEITNWHEIMEILHTQLEFSDTDVNAHQLGSYIRRFINQYLNMRRYNPKTMSLPELNNLMGQLTTAFDRAKKSGILDNILAAYSKKEKELLMIGREKR